MSKRGKDGLSQTHFYSRSVCDVILSFFFILYQTLQYGTRKCERDVDGSSPHRKGQEEVQTSEQRQIHFQDVFAGDSVILVLRNPLAQAK